MPVSTLVEYEMGYGADEFGNVLNGPFSGDKSSYECSQIARHHWSVTEAGTAFKLSIKVAEKPARQLGLFRLLVLDVKFDFNDTEVDLRERFMRRFHQYFHKGGG
jgi:hypothetical protein